jgi:hypothetical protein
MAITPNDDTNGKAIYVKNTTGASGSEVDSWVCDYRDVD